MPDSDSSSTLTMSPMRCCPRCAGWRRRLTILPMTRPTIGRNSTEKSASCHDMLIMSTRYPMIRERVAERYLQRIGYAVLHHRDVGCNLRYYVALALVAEIAYVHVYHARGTSRRACVAACRPRRPAARGNRYMVERLRRTSCRSSSAERRSRPRRAIWRESRKPVRSGSPAGTSCSGSVL